MKNEKLKKYIFEYNMVFANLLSIIILILVCLFTMFLYILFDKNIVIALEESIFGSNLIIFIILMFIWFFIHEIIHGMFYIINGADKDNITFGAALEKGIFYCKCGEFVNKKNIMISVIAPFTIIGVFTYIIAFIFDVPMLLFLSILNIIGTSGDLMMFSFFLQRDKNLKFKELEDSTKFCIETKEDLINKKFLAVKLIKVVDDESEINEEQEPLIKITKASKVILLIFLVIVLISYLLFLSVLPFR